MYTRGGRAAVTELSWSRLLEGMLQEREQSQKSEETYFTLLILSIVLNEGHSRPKAHLCIFSLCACAAWWTTSCSYRSWETGIIYSMCLCSCVGKVYVCVRACFSEVQTQVYGSRKCWNSTFSGLSVRCTASSVCSVNKPIVWITCIILKSRNELVCT